ncbi:MAG: oxygenase MpaB family protein [Flavitalea sp.]
MNYFVGADSVVRKIWGKADTLLLIFAGASAEFALNKAVDWLFFTGRLPADPIGRLFSTVEYARKIIFSPLEEANAAIDKMKNIHSAVEHARGSEIPDWAYRDVLFMLIYYSVSSFELLERKLTEAEKEENLQVFLKVGERMRIVDLPKNYEQWMNQYYCQQQNDLANGSFTKELFKQYRVHLGAIRYYLLVSLQKQLVSKKVAQLLNFNSVSVMPWLLSGYKIFRAMKAEWFIKSLVLPSIYKERIKNLDLIEP